MGHTLVATFNENFARIISEAGIVSNNKIPFRQGCDRIAANRILPYHATLFHWDKMQDIFYLPRIEQIAFEPCFVKLSGVNIMPSAGNGSLLYLKLAPDTGFDALCKRISDATGRPTESFLHITVSVSHDPDVLEAQYKALSRSLKLPMLLRVKALELYHIWDPVRLVKVIDGTAAEGL